ncbi:MAG: hypothetical protein LBI13_08835 [Streptococcaceae bacterium]|jgi:heme A synthase|nr:hypothetical protein [Streptococcaceae bacterium]
MKTKRWIFALFLLGVFLFLFRGGMVQADDGNLVIDNSPINQTGTNNANGSIGYQVAPYLFLDKTQAAQKKIETGTQNTLNQAKKQSFAKSMPKQVTVNMTPITQQLFPKTYTTAALASSSQTVSKNSAMPVWFLYLLIGGLLILAGITGVWLGQKFSKLFVKKEKARP